MDRNSNRRVAYFYHSEIGKFHYGKDHPMKPKRIAMAHELIVNYGLYKELNVYRPHFATREEMCIFHDLDYVKYLELVGEKVENMGIGVNVLGGANLNDLNEYEKNQLYNDTKKYKIGEISDCPKFAGLIDFCQISTGGSIDSACLIAENEADVCINWSGGLHHAKKFEASGFCYINDIVICILYLLRHYTRVLYVDIDVHHGDGVEEAFFTTNRVMTVSFHQYGDDFFPGSGNIHSIGEGLGKFHSINVPMKPGMNDETYVPLFKNVMNKVIEHFQPNVIVCQCGADSLVNDKLGNFNLSTVGHGECVSHVLKYGVPTILLGGGGYTITNVSRCWTYETAIALNRTLDNNLPKIENYYEHYNPDFKLHLLPKPHVENKNGADSLHDIEIQCYEYLKSIECAPGIPFHDASLPDNFRFATFDFEDNPEEVRDLEPMDGEVTLMASREKRETILI